MAWPPPELAARLAARARPVESFAPHVNAALPWLAYALLLALLPLVFPGGYALNLLAQMGIAVIACLSYNILTVAGPVGSRRRSAGSWCATPRPRSR